uniref:Uncharacterized protein n=1 Tax=Pseudomonas phage HRDY3 TaxID=3236930 RepID=A0AB39CER9_9VIRU
MSTENTERRPNVLLSYERIPDSIDFYFIPANSPVPLTLLHAILRLDQVFINHIGKSPDGERGEKDAAYLQAALARDTSDLDAKNEHGENRFFAVLEDYRLNPDEPAAIQVDGQLKIIRTGFIL